MAPLPTCGGNEDENGNENGRENDGVNNVVESADVDGGRRHK